MRVEFYYDLVSPYSYLAYGQLGRICEENGAALILRPMLLGAVHKEAGVKAPIETKLKARYRARDIRRWAQYYGVPLRFPDPFPLTSHVKDNACGDVLAKERRAGGFHRCGLRPLLGGERGAERFRR